MPNESLVTYHDMPVGRVFRPHVFDLDAKSIADYERLFSPVAGSPLTGLLVIHARKSYITEGDIPSGGVMAQLGVAYHEPFVPGPGMQFQATVTEQYEKKDKGWVKLRSRLTHQGRHVATVEMIGVWPL